MKFTDVTIRAIDNGYIVVEGSGHYLGGNGSNCHMSFPDLLSAWNFVEQNMIKPEDFVRAKAAAKEEYAKQCTDKQFAQGAVANNLSRY